MEWVSVCAALVQSGEIKQEPPILTPPWLLALHPSTEHCRFSVTSHDQVSLVHCVYMQIHTHVVHSVHGRLCDSVFVWWCETWRVRETEWGAGGLSESHAAPPSDTALRSCSVVIGTRLWKLHLDSNGVKYSSITLKYPVMCEKFEMNLHGKDS